MALFMMFEFPEIRLRLEAAHARQCFGSILIGEPNARFIGQHAAKVNGIAGNRLSAGASRQRYGAMRFS
jgi:hypothetical protein